MRLIELCCARVGRSIAGLVLAATLFGFAAPAQALPPIRIVAGNEVPKCVTPAKLMAFLRGRNTNLDPRFARIAEWYKFHGERWRVRWDYAFYQMALETNFLTYRRPNGRWGDVDPKQNNFAGLGTTGGGVPGDSYPDVKTGVLAQIHHLIVYSGERLSNPAGHRTRKKQGVILRLSRPIAARRLVTFQDLSGRWAVDKKYGRSIEFLATRFRQRYCGGRPEQALERRANLYGNAAGGRNATQWSTETLVTASAQSTSAPRAMQLGGQSAARRLPRQTVKRCSVAIASYGGDRAVLIEAVANGERTFTALNVEPAQAETMVDAFIKSYARGGRAVGTYANRRDALTAAFKLCPTAATARGGQ